jgi:hypothetical protein
LGRSGVGFCYELCGVEPADQEGFFEGWPNPLGLETHIELLQRSDDVVLAVETESHRGIGFVTVLTDRVHIADISLLEVGPELIHHALERATDICMMDVTCGAEVHPFYESPGFTKSTGACVRCYDF